MDSRFFDVFHNSADHNLLVVAKRVHIDFICVFKELVDQDRALVRNLNCRTHVVIEGRFVIDDDHRAAPEHVRWTDKNGIADLTRDAPGFFQRDSRAVLRLRDTQLAQQLSEPLAIFCKVDRFGRGSDYRHAGVL